MTENGEGETASDIDVAGILAALRSEVRARRLAQGQAEEGPLERDLRRSLDEIELHRVISAHWPLLGKTVPQRASQKRAGVTVVAVVADRLAG